MTIAVSILPIVSIIFVGFISVRLGLVPREKWGGVEALGFNVLIPAIIINSIYKSDLSASQVGTYVWVLILVIGVCGLLSLSVRLFLPTGAASFPKLTTLFQSTTRWNAFVALAAGEQIAGGAALSAISVAMAFIIPAINVVNIVVLTTFGEGRATVTGVISGIAKNPLVVACVVGLALNLSGMPLPGQVLAPLDLISRGALAVGLLAVGASLDLKRLLSPSIILVLGVCIRCVLCPVMFLLLGRWVGLDTVQLTCGVLICGVPAASNGYIVAKKMGGDAELYADIVTWQTIIAPFSISVALYGTL